MTYICRFILAAVLTLTTLIPAANAATSKKIVLLSYGGPWDQLTQKYVADPFTKETGIPVIIRPGSDRLIGSLLVQKDNPQYDLALIGYDAYVLLKEKGVLDTIDYNKIPNAKNLYPMAKDSQGVATSITGVTLVYNTEKIHTPPSSWLDLGKSSYSGHVAIPTPAITYGLDTLVMVARAQGGGVNNIDPGFQALADWAPHLSAIYRGSSQAAQLFQQGGVWLAPWFSGRVVSTREAGVPVATATPKEGAVAYRTMLVPLKGRFNDDIAKFINFYLAKKVQREFAREFASGPSRIDVTLPPDVAKTVPYGKENVSKLVQLDWKTIIQHRDAWIKRFQREIATKIR